MNPVVCGCTSLLLPCSLSICQKTHPTLCLLHKVWFSSKLYIRRDTDCHQRIGQIHEAREIDGDPSTDQAGGVPGPSSRPQDSKDTFTRPCDCPEGGRNLIVCIDGTSNQFGPKVCLSVYMRCCACSMGSPSWRRHGHVIIEHECYRAVQSNKSGW